MNDNGKNDPEALRSLLLLAELEKGEPISQREIARRLGIALGLVNSYLKTLVKKGFVQVKAYPRNRFAYLLTPKGFAEKSQLAYRHLSNFHKLYRITRQESLTIFRSLRERGVERVAFCGLDDLTEIAYLSLREAGLELAAVMDDQEGLSFLGIPAVSLEEGVAAGSGPVVITSLPRAGELKSALLALGVAEKDILAPSYSYKEVLSE
jgi:DNA-binding MarR family transcriptional regulator